jgi:G3E family GTPase
MDMFIIAGFLGSGKTTLVLSVIGRIIERTGKKVVIIVNDFGKVGIDSKVMTKYGLQVTELASGCICCTLGPDLLSTVADIEANIDPDLIVIEPTGVADPEAIVDCMQHYQGKKLRSIRAAVVVDASRFQVLMKAMGRPLTAQVRAADLILINKMDTVDAAALESIEKVLREINTAEPIIPISATEGTNVEKVVDAMVGA